MNSLPLTRRELVAGTVATAIGFAGCVESTDSSDEASSSGGSGEPGTLGTPTDAIDVVVTSQPMPAFDPEIVHLEPGGTITWTVSDGRHDVTSYHPESYDSQFHGDDETLRRIPDGATPWSSDLMTRGNTFARTLEIEGVYDYVDTQTVCTSHEVVGAIGRIVVGWPALDREPALAPPSEELPRSAVSKLESFNERTREVLEDD